MSTETPTLKSTVHAIQSLHNSVEEDSIPLPEATLNLQNIILQSFPHITSLLPKIYDSPEEFTIDFGENLIFNTETPNLHCFYINFPDKATFHFEMSKSEDLTTLFFLHDFHEDGSEPLTFKITKSKDLTKTEGDIEIAAILPIFYMVFDTIKDNLNPEAQ